MKVVSLRGKVTTTCPGAFGYDAEATVEQEDGKTLYAHMTEFEDNLAFTVSETSVFDCMTGASDDDPQAMFLEEYDGLGGASGSKYIKVFEVLDQMVALMDQSVL